MSSLSTLDSYFRTAIGVTPYGAVVVSGSLYLSQIIG